MRQSRTKLLPFLYEGEANISYRKILLSSDEVVYLQVEGQKIAVHKALLCHFSKYFKAALNGSFAEAQSSLAPIETSTKVFGVVLCWLYSGKMPEHGDEDLLLLNERLAETYVFADKYDLLALRRAALDASKVCGRTFFFANYNGPICGSLPSNSPYSVRLAFSYVHHLIAKGGTKGDTKDISDMWLRRLEVLPQALLAAIVLGKTKQSAARLLGTPIKPCPCCNDMCRFHEHESEDEKQASRFSPYFLHYDVD